MFVRKNRKWLEMNPVVWAVVILISWLMMSAWLYSSFQAYANWMRSNQKLEMEQVFDKMALNSFAGEWTMTDVRIKRNIYLLKNGSNTIDVYSYREVFKTQPWTNQVLSTPTIEFDRFYKVSLSDDGETKMVFLPESPLDIDKVTKLWVQVDSPNNTITAFSADSGFREMTNTEINMVWSDDARTRVYQSDKYKWRNIPWAFYKWDYVNQVAYWRVVTWCAPPWCVEYPKLKIWIQYKKDIVWYLELDKDANKFKYSNLDITIPPKYNTMNHCTVWNDSLCHPNYEYNAGQTCTYAFWYCYTNWATWTKPNSSVSCTWNNGACN